MGCRYAQFLLKDHMPKLSDYSVFRDTLRVRLPFTERYIVLQETVSAESPLRGPTTGWRMWLQKYNYRHLGE